MRENSIGVYLFITGMWSFHHKKSHETIICIKKAKFFVIRLQQVKITTSTNDPISFNF